jgi:hypothetical protein
MKTQTLRAIVAIFSLSLSAALAFNDHNIGAAAFFLLAVGLLISN